MPKKYSLNVEKNRILSVEVDGVRYDRPESIPDPDDRARVEALLAASPGLDLAAQPSGPDRFTRTLFFIFLGVAMLMLAITAYSGFLSLQKLSREQRAPGQVFDLIARTDSSGSTYYYPVVEYYLPDATRQRVELTEGSWPPAYEKGQPVTIFYDPDRPGSVRIDSFSSTLGLFILPLITGILTAAFLAATFFVYWMSKPSPSGRISEL